MQWIDTHPEVEVEPAEYQRLLGYPRGVALQGRSRELADWARAWYAEYGRPWIYAREAGTGRIPVPAARSAVPSAPIRRLPSAGRSGEGQGRRRRGGLAGDQAGRCPRRPHQPRS